jgi:hypothetical protein
VNPKINANGTLGLKHTRNVADISDSMMDVISKTEINSFVATSNKKGSTGQNFSPKSSFMSVVTAPTQSSPRV